MLQAEDRRLILANNSLTTRQIHLAATERVIQTMHERLCEPLSLENLADVACLSPYYFNRIFHYIIGVPPGEFLATLRMNRAKQLLLTTSLSVTDICFEVGYTGLGSFTTRFTQQVGLPPRYLRQCAKNIAPPSSLPRDTDTMLPLSCILPGEGVSGQILTRYPFRGLIYAGLFHKAIPQGRPIRCTHLSAPGPYHISQVPDGRYFLMVAAFPLSKDPYTYLLPSDNMLVGTSNPLLVHHGKVAEPIDVMLHSPRLTDPPIISVVPFI